VPLLNVLSVLWKIGGPEPRSRTLCAGLPGTSMKTTSALVCMVWDFVARLNDRIVLTLLLYLNMVYLPREELKIVHKG